MNNESYYKYMKYKTDYLDLNIVLQGGYDNKNNNLVIHICGASGSGKTTLGNKLKEKFGDKIVVKDLDDLRHEFVVHQYGYAGYDKFKFNKSDNWNKDAYQKWIDKYVSEQIKPLIFVGLNHMPWWHKNVYYNVHFKKDCNFFIRLDSDTIFKQKCKRFLDGIQIDKDNIVNDIMKNEKNSIKVLQNDIQNECGYKNTKKQNKLWIRDYKKQGYKFMSREDIYDKVVRIIEQELK